MTIRLSRIAMLLAASTVMTALGGVVATYFVAKDEFRDVLDHDLKTQSKLLIELIASDRLSLSDPGIADLLANVFEYKDEETIWVNVYDTVNGRQYSNHENPSPPNKTHNGDVHLKHDGHNWRGYQRVEENLIVQFLRRDDSLDEVQEEILEDIATPMSIASAINLLLLAALIGLTLRPLHRLSRQLETRSANSLSPVDIKTPAEEIVIFRDTLNRLIGEVDGVLARERQFANDVAHELRTPLTTLKLELASPEPDVVILKSEVDRLAQMVRQLLTLARVEQGHWQRNIESVDMQQVCESEIQRLMPLLQKSGIELRQDINPATVSGDNVLLEILIQNLLSNVVRHCEAGTHAGIELEVIDGRARLQITDDGPGVDDARLAQLNAGITRLDSRGEGLGLGLSICRKIADVHGATLTFSANANRRTGLTVHVLFPA